MAKKNTGRTVTVDFSGVSSGGGRFRVPEGDYKFKVDKVEMGTSKSSGNTMVTVTFVGTEGRVKGKKPRDYFTFTKDSLWKLRGFMEALGIDTPDSKTKVDVDAFVGKKVGITLGDDEYEGKVSSKPQDYIPYDEVDAEPEDDEEDEDEEEDEDDEDEDEEDGEVDLDEMDRDELKAFIKERGLDVRVGKNTTEKQLRKKIEAAMEDDDEVEDVDLDEEM